MTSETIFEQNLLWYAMIYARTSIFQTNTKLKKSNEPREKRSFWSVQLFSTCTCVRAASRSDWNEPLETDLFHSFGCHQPSSSEDFPLFLGTARWEAARWSCCWHNLRNGQQPSTKFFKSLMIILAARRDAEGWCDMKRDLFDCLGCPIN